MASTDESRSYTEQVVGLILTDPEFRALMQTSKRSGLGTVVDPRVTAYLKQRGIDLPPHVYLRPNGLVGEDEQLPAAARIAVATIATLTGASALSGLRNPQTPTSGPPTTPSADPGYDDIYANPGSGTPRTGTLGTVGRILSGQNPTANTILDAAGRVSNVLGQTAAGRQQGRQAEAEFQQAQDRIAQQRYLNQLAGARLRLEAPQERAKTSVRGDILSNAQDFSWGAPQMVGNIPVPTSRGGLRPSILSDASRTLGRDISTQAMTDQQEDKGRIIGDPPPLTDLPNVGGGDSLLNTAATITSLFGAIPYVRKPKQPSYAGGA